MGELQILMDQMTNELLLKGLLSAVFVFAFPLSLIKRWQLNFSVMRLKMLVLQEVVVVTIVNKMRISKVSNGLWFGHLTYWKEKYQNMKSLTNQNPVCLVQIVRRERMLLI